MKNQHVAGEMQALDPVRWQVDGGANSFKLIATANGTKGID